MRKTRFVFLITCLAIVGSLHAQTGTVTVDEINIQKIFIEANRDKLLGALDDAERKFKQVLEKDKNNHAAAYELARVQMAMDNYNNALESLKLALRLEPQNEWYLLLQGDLFEKIEDFGKAAETYESIVTSHPQKYYYFDHLIELYKKNGSYKKALTALEKKEEEMGVLETIVRDKFEVLDEMGKSDDALIEIQKLIDLYPDNIDYLQLAASYCKQSGKTKKSYEYYRKILEINPDDPKANIALADEFKSKGDNSAYLQSIRPIISNKNINLDVKIQELIPYLSSIGQKRDVKMELALEELVTSLVDAHPHEAKVHALYGDFLNYTGRLEQAQREYEKTLALDDSVFAVWEQLMYILAERKNFEALIRVSENAMDLFPNQGSIYYLNGLALTQKSNFHDAQSVLMQALIMTGKDRVLKQNVLSLLGNVYHELNKYEKSDEAFEKALDIYSDNTNVLANYAYFLSVRNENLGKAKNMAEKAIDLENENKSAIHALSWIHYREGNFEKAKELLEPIASQDDASPSINEHYGDILFEIGEKLEALKYWQSALERLGESPDLKQKIEENSFN